jgi:Heterokaryon incompatibility protein (HET)
MPAIDFKIGRWTNFKIDQSLQRPGKMKLMIKLLDAFVPLGEVFCYKYEDLDQDHIRLLRVLPGKGTETLCCQMVQEPLKNPPKFNTLSYTWGNSFDDNNRLDVVSTVKIFLNGRPHRITLNLLSALRFYRENYTDLLWVDYLSINQSNFIERGQQVLIMRNIYEQSSMVFIWLGDEADDSTLAIEFLELVSEEPTITASAAYIVRTIQSRNFLKEWKALDHFWKRPWWMRTWLVVSFLTTWARS